MLETGACEFLKLQCWAYSYAVLAAFLIFTRTPVVNALHHPVLAGGVFKNLEGH